MDPLVYEALKVLEFENLAKIPKLKEITRRSHKLAALKHPDKNGGTKAATAEFQNILSAYHTAGAAASDTVSNNDDNEEIIAKKMFKQFQHKSIKENSSSFTISTEKDLFPLWLDILTSKYSDPVSKGPNGNKFTVNDTCHQEHAKIFITLHTGKLIVQAQGNNQVLNFHLVNHHLEELYVQ